MNVGCGLETMFWRVGPDVPDARFYEMDLPEVIETRRRILKGKVGLYAKVAMAITDRTGRAFLLHMKL